MQRNISRFVGMDNVTGGGLGQNGLQPGLIVNAIVDDNGIHKREGFFLHIALPYSHSLSNGLAVTLCAGGSPQALYEVDLEESSTSLLQTIPGSREILSYIEIGDLIFISNSQWCGVYEDGSIRKWGLIIDELNERTWIRESNGSRYYMADPQGDVTTTLKPHDFVHAPNPMKWITHAFGRIWGVIGNRVVYSDEMSPEWFNDAENFIEFQSEPQMIARSKAGLFIGLADQTVFLSGTNPEDMSYHQQAVKPFGAVPNTLQYTGGFKNLGFDTPVWIDPQGKAVAGLADGSIADITGGQVRFDVSAGVGSLFRMYKGKPQYLATVMLPDDYINGDPVTHDWVLNIYKKKLSSTVNLGIKATGRLLT